MFYICTFIFLFILGTSECPLLGRDHYDRQKTNCSSGVVLTGSLHGEILPLPIQKIHPICPRLQTSCHISILCAGYFPIPLSPVRNQDCAIKWVHGLVPLVSNPADSPLIRNLVEASKRSQHASPSKKKSISLTTLSKVVDKYAKSNSDLKDVRTAFLFTLGFFGLFRASELISIKAKDITINTDHLVILVPKIVMVTRFIFHDLMNLSVRILCFSVIFL